MGNTCCSSNVEKPKLTIKPQTNNDKKIKTINYNPNIIQSSSILEWGNDKTLNENLLSKNISLIFECSSENDFRNLDRWEQNFAVGQKGKYLIEYDDKLIIYRKDSMKQKFARIFWVKENIIFSQENCKLLSDYVKEENNYLGIKMNNNSEIPDKNIQILKNSKLKFIKSHLSLLDREIYEKNILEYCENNELYFFSDLVLENGALSGKYNFEHPFPSDSPVANIFNPQIEKIENLNKILKQFTKIYNCNILQIPISWVISKGAFPIIKINEINESDFNDIINFDKILDEGDAIGLPRDVDIAGIKLYKY